MNIWLVLLMASVTAFDQTEIQLTENSLEKSCARAPKVEVSWSEFGEDAGAKQAVIKSGLQFLRSAGELVCEDAMLKREFGKQVRKIVIRQAYGAADPMIYLTGDQLNIEYLWSKNGPAPDAAYVAGEIASRLRGEEMEAP